MSNHYSSMSNKLKLYLCTPSLLISPAVSSSSANAQHLILTHPIPLNKDSGRVPST